MGSYADTGVLAKLYCRESDSQRAADVLTSCRMPLLLCSWQLVEVGNAMRLKVYRKEITRDQFNEADAWLRSDIESGAFSVVPLDLELALSRAGKLSEEWTARLGCRTLDIIHVSAALLIEADELVTFDRRQGDLAVNVGLKVRGV